jgi:hypothetical protein
MSGWRPEERRQRVIVRRLGLIGEGPAAHFTDACRLMEGDMRLDSTSHLVAHLLREVQSALNAVLIPMVPDGRWPAKGSKDAQALQISAMCDALRVPTEDELRNSWKAFAGTLNRYAHRDGLARSRPVDEEFELFWDRGQAVLFAVSGRIEATYAEALPRIERLALGDPDVKAFMQSMLHSTVALDRFFELAGVAWLEPLRAKGYFDDPPPLVPNEEGGYEFPRWPQGRFLARVAREAPRGVVEIGRALHTDNPEAHQSLVDAAGAMSVADALPLVDPICEWLQTPIQWALPFKARDLAVHLFEGGATEEGLALARALLTNPESEAGDDVAGEHLDWLVPRIFPAAGLAGLEMVTSLLKRRLGGKGADAHSYIWRPNIASGRRGEDREQVVDGARVAAETLAQSGTPIASIVAALEAPDMQIGRRLALDLLSRHPTSEAARERLLDRATLEEPATRREYLALAGGAFGNLRPEDQERLLAWIDEGRREEEDPRRRRLWQLQVLSALGDGLPAAWESRRRTLVEEFGELDPDPPRMVATYRGEMSPLDLGELRLMEVDALIDYLRDWAPDNDMPTPTTSGLARTLEDALAANPARYAVAAPAFAELEAVYVGAVLGGLRKAVERKTPFDWGPVLDLAEATMGASQWVASDRPRTEGAAARARVCWDGADLIFHGLFRGEAEIPYGTRGQLWRILSGCFSRHDPTEAIAEEREGRDPASLAVSSVPCRTLQGLCRLAVRDREEGAEGLWPELASLLEQALEPPVGSSPPVRWTLGRSFRDLLFADEGWTTKRCAHFFPLDGDPTLWRAAWEGYIHSAPPAPVLLKLLGAQYRRAIEELSAEAMEGRLDDPDGALVANLMSHYLTGTIDFDEPDGLLDLFYSRASTKRRELAIDAIGHGLDSPGSPAAEAVARMEALAERRLRAVQEGAPPAELSGFAWWLESGEFEVEWSLGYLRKLLDAGGTVQPDHMVAEWLARLSGAFPLATVEILRRMVEGAVRDWFVIGAREPIEAILGSGLAAGGEAASVARDVVNIIVSQGATEFARLLDESDGE